MAFRRSLLSLLAVCLVVVTGVSAALLLKACNVALPVAFAWIGNCPSPAALDRAARLTQLDAQHTDLVQSIAVAEAKLSRIQCTAAQADPNPPLSPEDWREGKLAALYGCWDLSDSYRTRNVETRDVIGYPAWQMCFDTEGKGRQIMRDLDGIACEGPVAATFDGKGTLKLAEPGNLPCSDGGYVHRREITCTAGDTGTAQCDTLQPETDGQAKVEFRRSARQL